MVRFARFRNDRDIREWGTAGAPRTPVRKEEERVRVCSKREDTCIGQVCRVLDVKAVFDSLKER